MAFEWLKDKISRKPKFKFSEKEARAYQTAHTERLEGITKDLSKEFVEFNEKLKILNNNSWGVHHLYKKAYSDRKYAEAFLYFFYSFELTLKHLIMTEMMVANQLKFLEEKKNMFSVYSSTEINDVQECGHIAKLIDKFCSLHGKRIEPELKKINWERNFIIHNMMKNQLTEGQIESSFKDFFDKTSDARAKFYAVMDSILADRPRKILSKLEELSH